MLASPETETGRYRKPECDKAQSVLRGPNAGHGRSVLAGSCGGRHLPYHISGVDVGYLPPPYMRKEKMQKAPQV